MLLRHQLYTNEHKNAAGIRDRAATKHSLRFCVELTTDGSPFRKSFMQKIRKTEPTTKEQSKNPFQLRGTRKSKGLWATQGTSVGSSEMERL